MPVTARLGLESTTESTTMLAIRRIAVPFTDGRTVYFRLGVVRNLPK